MMMENINKKFIYRFDGRGLCPLKKEHCDKIKEFRNLQIDVLRQQEPLTDHNQDKWFQKISTDEKQVIFSIMLHEENNSRFIGYCGITNIDFKNRRGEISFLVDPIRVNKKEVYRADFISVLYMLCTYGFEELCLHKLFTETYAFREHHMNILGEFGFHLDGVLIDHKFTRGKYYNSHIHSLLLDDWRKIKIKFKNENVLEK